MLKKSFLYLFLTFSAAIFFHSVPVSAAPSTINAPFDTGSTWYVCQGYNGPITHQGVYALDITSAPGCDRNAPWGQNIRAPLDGTVAWYGSGAGSLCINTTDGRSIALYHINSSLRSLTKVTRGQIVGSLGAPGTVANGGIPHLHLEMWASPGCPNNFTRIPFDLEHSSRICGAPNMTAAGPDYFRNGTWSGVSFTAESCTRINKGESGSVYRFWSDRNQRHFYTVSYEEAQQVADKWPEVWKYEGVAYIADLTCGGPTVYRFWSDKLSGHFYTASVAERDEVIAKRSATWQYEGVAYCSADPTAHNTKPVYRFWSNSKQAHFYTASNEEQQSVIVSWPHIWTYEGVAFSVK
jgi:murein DD-endopeptidase MepM/ murein hydrolase activator NlpD